jgi:hypothetical protein
MARNMMTIEVERLRTKTGKTRVGAKKVANDKIELESKTTQIDLAFFPCWPRRPVSCQTDKPHEPEDGAWYEQPRAQTFGCTY